MKKVYEVRIVEMDENFGTSLDDEVSGFVSYREAKKIHKEWLANLKKNKPTTNCYICIEVGLMEDGEDEPMWIDQIDVVEFRVDSAGRV